MSPRPHGTEPYEWTLSPSRFYRHVVIETARRCVGQGPDCCQDAAPSLNLCVVEWCQIFWLYCLREGGLTELTWEELSRPDPDDAKRRRWIAPHGRWPSAWLETTTAPEQGDMVYVDKRQHGGVFDRADGDWIYSIDGNSFSLTQPYGEVRGRKWRRSEITTCYSIRRLIEEAVPPEYR